MKVMKNEGDVKKHVKAILQATPKCYWFMPSANGFGRAGIPDFVGWVDGHAFVIETKFGSNDCTQHQLIELNKATVAGAKTWLVRETSLESWIAEFTGWVALCS